MNLRRAALACGGNALYGVFLGALGVYSASSWLLALGGFYGLLAALRLGLFLCLLRAFVPTPFALRTTGQLLLALAAVWAIAIAIGLRQNTARCYPTIPMIAIATYTFCKIGLAIGAAARRAHRPPLYGALQRMRLAEAAASVFLLQQSMLASFGSMTPQRQLFLNGLTGAGACLFLAALGIFTIKQARKERITWQNQIL